MSREGGEEDEEAETRKQNEMAKRKMRIKRRKVGT